MSIPPGRVPLALVLSLLACGGDGVGPPAGTRLYPLVSVAGQPLPFVLPPSVGLALVITHGDLLLRSDGTYALGLGGGFPVGALAQGSYTMQGSSVVLAGDAGGITAAAAGDSLVLTLDRDFVFRRATLPRAPVADGTWVLASVNGSADLSWTTTGPVVYVQRVLYDTISVFDGALFRRARATRQVGYVEGDSLVAEKAWVTHGSAAGGAGWLVLRDYAAAANSVALADSLALVGSGLRRELTRSVPGGGSTTLTELYSRIR